MNNLKADSKSQPNNSIKPSNEQLSNPTSAFSSIINVTGIKKDKMQKKTQIVEPEEDLSRREKDFITYFGYLNEKLISHYSCACQGMTDIVLHHGRMFITEHHICFSSHLLGEYLKVIPFKEVIDVVKENTALVIPNAISVEHKHGTELFTSLTQRNIVYDLLYTLWNKNKGERKLGINLKQVKIEQQKVNEAKEKEKEKEKEAKGTKQETKEEGESKDTQKEVESNNSTTPRHPENNENNKEPKPNNIVTDKLRHESTPSLKSQSNDRVTIEENNNNNNNNNNENVEEEPENFVLKRRNSLPENPQQIDSINDRTPEVPPPLDLTVLYGKPKDEKPEVDTTVYPPIGTYNGHIITDKLPCIDVVFPNLQVKEFYARFLGNREFWRSLWKKMECTDINIPEWTIHPTHFTRICEFIAPIKGVGFGPKQTRNEQTQQVSFVNENKIIFDTSNKAIDIPYADSFVIQSVWTATNESKGVRLTVSWKAHFLKSTMMKGIIEKSSKTPTESFYNSFVSEVKAALVKKPKGKKEATVAAPGAKKKLRTKKAGEKKKIKKKSAAVVKESPENIPNSGYTRYFSFQKLVLIGTIIYVLIVGLTYLTIRINSLEHEIDIWKGAFNQIDDRLIFLQSFAARVALNHSLDVPEEYQREMQELDWRLDEWKESFMAIQSEIDKHLKSSTSVLNGIAESSAHLGNSGKSFQVISERHLNALLNGYQNKVHFAVDDDGSSIFYDLLSYLFLFGIAIVTGGLVYTYEHWVPVIKPLIGL